MECACFHGVKRTTLQQGINQGRNFIGGGCPCVALTDTEEELVANHMHYKAAIGYGESWQTLRLLLKEIMLKIKSANPQRITGLENNGQLPSIGWVQRFAQ